MSLSDELRTWPFSSKKVGKALLAYWADKVEALEAELARMREENTWMRREIERVGAEAMEELSAEMARRGCKFCLHVEECRALERRGEPVLCAMRDTR